MQITLAEWGRRHAIPDLRLRKIRMSLPVETRNGKYFIDDSILPPSGDVVECEVCHRQFKQIASRHLQLHDLTMAEYRSAYPDARLMTDEVEKSISKGKQGQTRDQKTRDLISRNRKGKSPTTRGSMSQETREKISKSRTGKTLSEEHKRAISEGGLGRVQSAETKSKIAASHYSRSEVDRQLSNEKTRHTMMARYGAPHNLAVPEIEARTKETNLRRYGYEMPLESSVIREKAAISAAINHDGQHPSKTSHVKEKIRATNILRYGAPSTMAIARAAFSEQSGFENPFNVPAIREKSRQTMMARYGVEYPLQSYAILKRMLDNNIERFGVTSVLARKETRQKIAETIEHRYGRKSPHQIHISDENYEILQDDELFRTFMKDKSLRSAASELNICYDSVRRYCYRYGIDLPKSSYEREVSAFIHDLVGSKPKIGDRKVIAPLEIDILVAEYGIGIEFCGLYWHGEQHKSDRLYHLIKLISMEQIGYRLITIFEDEWVNKRSIVERRLRHIFGFSEKGVPARKLEIRRIKSRLALDFFKEHHLQGAGPHGFASYGAFEGTEMIAAMNFCKARRALGRKSGEIELLRFATSGKTHAGVASRLFRRFVKDHDPSGVITYADRRWSQGELYKAMGFSELNPAKPGYWYVNNNKVQREHRYRYRKSVIKHQHPDGERMTEREIMIDLGYYRIWDCGNLRYLWTKS
jgi:hypothetical protein